MVLFVTPCEPEQTAPSSKRRQKMWETARVCFPPSLGGEHLWITLSISASLAPILVECELVFVKSQGGHLVTLSGRCELRWAQMITPTGKILGPTGISTAFHLGDLVGLFPSSMPASMHSWWLRGRQRSFGSLMSFHGFVTGGRVREVSVPLVLRQQWRHRSLLITVQPFWESYKTLDSIVSSWKTKPTL